MVYIVSTAKIQTDHFDFELAKPLGNPVGIAKSRFMFFEKHRRTRTCYIMSGRCHANGLYSTLLKFSNKSTKRKFFFVEKSKFLNYN